MDNPQHIDFVAGMVASELLSTKEGLEAATRIDMDVMRNYHNAGCSVMYLYACHISNVHVISKELFAEMREFYARYVSVALLN